MSDAAADTTKPAALPPLSQNGARAVDYALLMLLATCWAASYTFTKVGIQTIPPLTFMGVRSLLAAGLLLGLLWWRGLSLPSDAASWRMLLLQALLNSVLPFQMIGWAQQWVDASLATVLASTSPIFTFLITWALTRNEPATWAKLAGVLAGIAGIALIVGPKALVGNGPQLLAELVIVAAAVCFASGSIFGRHLGRLDPMVAAAGSLAIGGVVLTPLSLVFDQPWTLHPSAASITALVMMAVISSALGLLIFYRLLKTLGPIGTMSQAYLRVPIGVAIPVFLLGEQLASSAYAGLALVVAGVAAMTIPERRRPRP